MRCLRRPIVTDKAGVGDDPSRRGQDRDHPPQVPTFADSELPGPGNPGTQADQGRDPERRRGVGLVRPTSAGQQFDVADAFQPRAVTACGDEPVVSQDLAEQDQEASADGLGQGVQRPYRKTAQCPLESLGSLAGASSFGSTNRGDPPRHFESFGSTVAERPDHGQEGRARGGGSPSVAVTRLGRPRQACLHTAGVDTAAGNWATVWRGAARPWWSESVAKTAPVTRVGEISRFGSERLEMPFLGMPFRNGPFASPRATITR